MDSFILIRSRFVLPVSEKLGLNKRIEDGYVLVQNQTIKEIGQYSNKIGEKILKEYGESGNLKILGCNKRSNYSLEDIKKLNAVTVPGFVKAHGHDHESPLIGIAKDTPLTEWLDRAVNLFTGFMGEEYEKLVKIFGKSPYLVSYVKARLDDVSYGITSAMTHHCNWNKYHIDELVEANSIIGTNLIIAVGSQDRHYDDRILDTPEEAIKRLDDAYEKHKNNSRIKIIPGPDQFFSNGPELLKALKRWARDHKTLIHCHSSEEPKTTKWFTEKYAMTPVEYAKSIDFLDENTVLAHQVNNTEKDLQLLAETRTKIVHNPLANTILGSGMPPILKMREMGIPVAISTDGSGSADHQNIINAARVASQYQKALHQNARVMTAQDVLEMITIKPAQMLGFNAGSLEAGKDADITIIDLSVPTLTPTRIDTVTENIIWAASGNEIRDVIANGKILIENYQFKGINKDQILEEVQKLSDLFAEYQKTAKEIKGTGAHT